MAGPYSEFPAARVQSGMPQAGSLLVGGWADLLFDPAAVPSLVSTRIDLLASLHLPLAPVLRLPRSRVLPAPCHDPAPRLLHGSCLPPCAPRPQPPKRAAHPPEFGALRFVPVHERVPPTRIPCRTTVHPNREHRPNRGKLDPVGSFFSNCGSLPRACGSLQ